jgi:hypothetical protein
LQEDLAQQKVVLALSRVSPDLQHDLDRLELTRLIGSDHIFPSRHECLAAYAAATGTG